MNKLVNELIDDMSLQITKLIIDLPVTEEVSELRSMKILMEKGITCLCKIHLCSFACNVLAYKSVQNHS